MKNILITRTKNRSQELAKLLEKEGYRTFFQPLFSVVKKNITKDFLNINKPEINNIIITSANAIDALQQLDIKHNVNIFTIGKQTAKKINQCGYQNIFYPTQPSAQNLKNLILKNLNPQKIYYLRGEKISYDFKKILTQKGFIIEDLVVYKTHEIDNFSPETIDLIQQNCCDEILIFSQNSLAIFYKICLRNNLIEYLNSSSIICFSDNIKKSAQEIGFKNAKVFHNNPFLNKFYDNPK